MTPAGNWTVATLPLVSDRPGRDERSKPDGYSPRGLKNLIRSRTTKAVRQSCRDLWTEIQLQRRHFASLKKARRLPRPADLKLHLGCGPCLKPGWINVDINAPGADLQLDLREKLPFPDAGASFVYCEHFFEHLDYPSSAMNFLRECWRVL